MAEEARVVATEKARLAEQERARLALEGAQAALEQAAVAEQKRLAAEKALAEHTPRALKRPHCRWRSGGIALAGQQWTLGGR